MARTKGTRNGEGKPYKRGDTYYAAITINGELRRVSLRTSNYRKAVQLREELARKWNEEAMSKAVPPKGCDIPIGDAWKVFEPFSKTLTPRLAREYKKNWTMFAEYCEENGAKKVSDIGKRIGMGFLAKLAEKGKSANSIAKYRVQCAKVVSEVTEGAVANPFRGIDMSKMAKGEVWYDNLSIAEVMNLILMAETYEKTRNDAGVGGGEEWTLLFQMASETGLRLKDLCLLKWEDVKLDDGNIDTTTYKTGAHVVIPLFGELLEGLRRMHHQLWMDSVSSVEGTPDDISPYVMPNLAKKYQSGDNSGNIDVNLREIFSMAIPGSRTRVDTDGQKYKKSFHSFRVHFASRLGAAGCPLPVAVGILGHAEKMFLHYFRADESVAKEYVSKALGIRKPIP